MKDFQQRVVDEKRELDTKIAALEQFKISETHNDLDAAEQHRLAAQLRFMQAYSATLGARIEAFVPDEKAAA